MTLQPPSISFLFGPDILLSILSFNVPPLMSRDQVLDAYKTRGNIVFMYAFK
jgi:hypothetical protein